LSAPREWGETFDCFGGQCTVLVSDARRPTGAEAAVRLAKGRLLEWHGRFSRFLPDSELSLMNSDPSPTVHVTPLMRRLLETSVHAAEATGGLVDPTLLTEIERAGYGSHLAGDGPALEASLTHAPARVKGGPSEKVSWQGIEVDRASGTVTRPPGIRFDPCGIAKGVFADELGALLAAHDAFVVDCAGDIRVGGAAALCREVHVASPFDESVLHTSELVHGGVATSGIGKRSWIGADGQLSHHLLDPRTGRPAFTGVVQATALAPTAAEAEALAKAAILSGPEDAPRWLPHGGVIVLDDGSHRVIEVASQLTLR
jgi:FAD:protein FMN transferase